MTFDVFCHIVWFLDVRSISKLALVGHSSAEYEAVTVSTLNIPAT